jgi:hypothetical protein
VIGDYAPIHIILNDIKAVLGDYAKNICQTELTIILFGQRL